MYRLTVTVHSLSFPSLSLLLTLMLLCLTWQGYLGYTDEQEVHAWRRFWVLDVTGVRHRVSPEPTCTFVFFIYSFINAYNATIFHISALKYCSKLGPKCIRTQADMVYLCTDLIYLMTFDPQPTLMSVLVNLIYAVHLWVISPRIFVCFSNIIFLFSLGRF